MTEKSLVVKKNNSIFNKIINFFKSIFYKKAETKKVNKEKVENIIEKNNAENIAKEKVESKKELNDKDKFFKLYEEIKSKKVKIDDLSISEVIVFNAMLSEEIDMKLKKINEKIQS